MSANFAPGLASGPNMSAFRFWCQKVLPLAYDDSLSYYELLCKVVDHLNRVIENENTVTGDVQKMYEAFVALENYVNRYFEEADFESLVENALNEMVLNGTLASVINEEVFGEINQRLNDVAKTLENIKVVTDYGADGDGVTDCTNAFRSALTGGGRVYIPTGRYVITGTLYLDSNTYLFGDGTIVDNVEAPSEYNMVYGVISVIDKTNCTIDGVRIESNITTNGHVNKSGILVQRSNNVHVINVSVNNTDYGSCAIEFFGATNCSCFGCYVKEFRFGGIGCYEESKNIKISNNTVINTVETNNLYTYGIIVSSYHTSDSLASKSYGCQNIICTNNYVNVNSWEAIDAHCGDGLVVNDNIAICGGSGIHLFGDTSRNMFIRNTTQCGNFVHAGTVYGMVADGENCILCNNTIENATDGIYLRPSSGGGLNGGVISNNYVKATRWGVYGGARVKNALVEGNTIDGAGVGEIGWNSMDYSLNFLDCSCLFKNNYIRGFTVSVQCPSNSPVQYHDMGADIRMVNNDYDVSTMVNGRNVKTDYILSTNVGTPPLAGNVGDIVKVIGATSGSPIALYCTVAHTKNLYNNTPAVYVPFGAGGW